MTLRSLLVVVSIFFSPIVFSQNIADCIDAVAVCETSSVNYEVIGIGDVNDLPISESGCLGDGGAGTGRGQHGETWSGGREPFLGR